MDVVKEIFLSFLEENDMALHEVFNFSGADLLVHAYEDGRQLRFAVQLEFAPKDVATADAFKRAVHAARLAVVDALMRRRDHGEIHIYPGAILVNIGTWGDMNIDKFCELVQVTLTS